MSEFKDGDLIVTVEHNLDGTAAGREFTGHIQMIAGECALVRYDPPGTAVLGTGCDPYWAQSGRRVLDGHRWRLRHQNRER